MGKAEESVFRGRDQRLQRWLAGSREPPLGPFYELETSSPAAALAPGKSMTHRQTTVHISGPAAALDPVATAKLGVSIQQITGAFANK